MNPSMRRLAGMVGVLGGLGTGGLHVLAGPGESAVVVYNARLPESRELAFYYAARREVPTNQVFGFELPDTETMSRVEFREQLFKPLIRALERQQLITVVPEIRQGSRLKPGEAKQTLTSAKVRYVVMCHGVPVSIAEDPALKEPGADAVKPELRRNEAAVDSELAALPAYWSGSAHLYGALANPAYNATQAASLHPTNGVLMVTRLDGPSVPIARGLVDKALEAERNGLWGRAYFDLRSLTNGPYKLGDDWMREAAGLIQRLGFETIVDTGPDTFPATFPMSHVAFYAGWYDATVSGPFARGTVEFQPGAVAYHLHSFSAHRVRDPHAYWVGPLLARGATVTMGCVYEPYLEATPDVAVFFSRLTLFGFTFGESAYASQKALSWQATVIGDPLYRPFGRAQPGEHFGERLRELHRHLTDAGSPLLEWSLLQVANLNLEAGATPAETLAYLESEPTTHRSAVLREKIAALYDSGGKLGPAIAAYEKALNLKMSPMQRQRVMLALARLHGLYQQNEQAYALYEQFLKEFPDYPDLAGLYRRMAALATELGRDADAARLNEEARRLTGSGGK